MGEANYPDENNNQQANNAKQNNNQQDNQNSGQQYQQYQQQYQQYQQQYQQYQQNNQYYGQQDNLNFGHQQMPHYQQPQLNGQSNYQQPLYTQPPKRNYGMAVASMICGIVSLTISCCFWYISLPVSVVGLILGILSIRNNEEGRGMAVAGITTSAITILFALLALLGCSAYFAWISDMVKNADYNTTYY